MNENTKILLILLLAGLLILSPYAFRIFQGNPYMINSEAYYNIRVSGTDSLQNRTLPFNILDFFNQNNVLFDKIIPLFAGILCVGLSLIIMKKHNISEKNMTAITLILVSSPIFLYTFLDLKYFSFTIILSLLTIYFIISKKYIISAIPMILIPFIDFYSSLIAIVLLILYVLLTAKNYKNYKALIILGAASIIAAILLNNYLGYSLIRAPIEKTNLITDVGAEVGFSFSSLILTLIGMVLLWDKGLKNLLVYILIVALFVLSVFNTTLKAYINFILVVYAGFAFVYLTKRKWSIQIIKKVTLLLIVCSIMFTTILYSTKLSKAEPTPGYVDALKFIKEQSLENEKVLSAAENGYLIEYYAERSAFIDEKTSIYEPKRLGIFNNLTTSRNLENTESILKEYSIKYIFIDDSFRQKLEADQGLLFLIENSQKFKEIFISKEVQVWMYTE
jgi:hypothetical protein